MTSAEKVNTKLATASLVYALIGCVCVNSILFVLGLAGVVCGLFALRKIQMRPDSFGGRRRAICGAILGGAAVLAGSVLFFSRSYLKVNVADEVRQVVGGFYADRVQPALRTSEQPAGETGGVASAQNASAMPSAVIADRQDPDKLPAHLGSAAGVLEVESGRCGRLQIDGGPAGIIHAGRKYVRRGLAAGRHSLKLTAGGADCVREFKIEGGRTNHIVVEAVSYKDGRLPPEKFMAVKAGSEKNRGADIIAGWNRLAIGLKKGEIEKTFGKPYSVIPLPGINEEMWLYKLPGDMAGLTWKVEFRGGTVRTWQVFPELKNSLAAGKLKVKSLRCGALQLDDEPAVDIHVGDVLVWQDLSPGRHCVAIICDDAFFYREFMVERSVPAEVVADNFARFTTEHPLEEIMKSREQSCRQFKENIATNWHRLKIGLGRNEFMGLFGLPKLVVPSAAHKEEVWLYDAPGSNTAELAWKVQFFDGKLTSWQSLAGLNVAR